MVIQQLERSSMNMCVTFHPRAILFDLGPGNSPGLEQTLPAFKRPQQMHM